MSIKVSNNATTSLIGSLSTAATSAQVLATVKFPALGASDYTYGTLISIAGGFDQYGNPLVCEIVKILGPLTPGALQTITITRAQDSTVATAFVPGDVLDLRINAATLRDLAGGAGLFLAIANNLSDVANPLTATSNLQYKNPTTGGVTRTVQAKLQDLDTPEDFGAVGDGVTNDAPAFQAMATAGGSYKLQPGKNYKLNSTITIPDGIHFKLIGDVFLGCTVTTPGSATIAFQYVRVGASSTFECEGILFQESGLGKLSFFCKWWGAAVGTDDNWAYFTRCSFKGYNHVHDVKFAQNCHYESCFYQGNNECFFFQRDASFQYIEDCLAINNGRCLNAQDATNDGISNGIFVSDTTFALTTNEDIFCLGFQLVQLSNTTCDLGGTGATNSVVFQNCDDVRILGGWIAVATAAIGTRVGLNLNTCHGPAVVGVKFTGCHIGIVVSSATVQNIAGSIIGCQFEANQVNEIEVLGNVVGLMIVGNTFRSVVSYTGSNFPVYANVAGNTNIIIANNWFVGVEYQIITPGKSVVTPNIFAGSAGADNFLVRYDASGNIVYAVDANNNTKQSGNLTLQAIGNGIAIKEGTNGSMGRATLAGGTIVVANTRVTANSEIFLMCQTPGGTPGFLRVSARTAATSFTILSSSGTDTSIVSWLIVEPAP